jgi:hypothetical protein
VKIVIGRIEAWWNRGGRSLEGCGIWRCDSRGWGSKRETKVTCRSGGMGLASLTGLRST